MFEQDNFKLMCNNAMIYNKPDTIYYKAAKKLLHSGMKILSQVTKNTYQNIKKYTAAFFDLCLFSFTGISWKLIKPCLVFVKCLNVNSILF